MHLLNGYLACYFFFINTISIIIYGYVCHLATFVVGSRDLGANENGTPE